MSDDNTQDANEPSLATAGSRPVAWAAGSLADRLVCVYRKKEDAEAARVEAAMGIACQEWEVFALCRPQVQTLTDDERQTIKNVAGFLLGICVATTNFSTQAMLRNNADRLLAIVERLG